MYYGFSIKNYPTLEAAADDAVKRIYTAGIMFHDGAIIPGGNNVMAGNAARAFAPDDLTQLKSSGSPRLQAFAEIIELRQKFETIASGYSDEARAILADIYARAGTLNQGGWNPGTEPHRIRGPRPV